MRPELLCGLLAEPARLRTYAAVVLGAQTPSEVASRTGLPARAVVAALHRLEQGGIVRTVDGRLDADPSVFKDAVREHAPESADVEPLDPDKDRAAVLRAFIVDGRLVQVPATRTKRRIVLEHIAECFEPGVRYPERAVDSVLRALHADYASLRRYLVDEDLLSRDSGIYWRTGGHVEV
jgi:hypothetical protein